MNAAAGGRTVIFGELHGAVEAPGAIAEYVCGVSTGRPVLVGVEWDAAADAALQAAWEADGFTSDFQLAPADRTNDGRGSQAMIDMLSRLHDLKRMGRDIHVVAFNAAETDARFNDLSGQEPHEMRQATNIIAAANRHPDAQTVILVGNLHARRTPARLGGTATEMMAMKLESLSDRPLLALDLAYRGGTAWNCILPPDWDFEGRGEPTQDDIDCGAHPVGHAGSGDGPGLRLHGPDADGSDGSPRRAYDGEFIVGPITASPPA